MKVTYEWLKDFVDVRLAPAALAERLTMAGLEVTAVEAHGGDTVFEIEVTSNRPDWLSVVGIAREVSAITGARLKKISAPRLKLEPQRAFPCRLRIADRGDCPLYTARLIKGVKVGPSPAWLVKRLAGVGCRSVNNVVDITNYVLFELGEPLHAFDANTLASLSVIVRRASAGERLVTIDGETRDLDPGILVIADEQRPIALAGIMGGKDTEVTEKTTDVLLEAALFHPVVVRRGRQRMGISSEAAYRFERGIDVAAVDAASVRAARLIQELCGGEVVGPKQAGRAPVARRKILLDVPRVGEILGEAVSAATCRSILRGLGFGARSAKTQKTLSIEVPSWRQDVKDAVDLIEEIARIRGYQNFPVSLPRFVMQRPDSTPGLGESVLYAKHILVGLGLQEVITHSLIAKEDLAAFAHVNTEGLVEIANPLSKEQEILRPLLAPSLIGCVAHNVRQKQKTVRIFEIAKTYSRSGGTVRERLSLAIALSGTRTIWHTQGKVQDEMGFLHLKGVVQTLFERLGSECVFKAVPGGAEVCVLSGGRQVGTLQRIPQTYLEKLDIKNRQVFCAELEAEALLSRPRPAKRFVPLPRYPSISRDISVVVGEELSVGEIAEAIRERAGALLADVEVTDYYRGRQIEAGHKNITLSLRYASPERTLTETEISPLHTAVVEMLKERFHAAIR